MPAKNSGKQRKIEYRRHCIKQLWIEYGIEQLADFKEALKEHYDLEVSVPTISRDLKAIKQRLIETDVDELKAYLKANYKFIVVEAYDAWRDSRKDKQTITNEAIEGGSGSSGERIKAQERTEGQSGNPALLAQAQAALKAIRELIGTDAIIRQEIKQTNFNADVSQLTDEQLQRIVDGENPLVVVAATESSGGTGETKA